MNQAQPQSLFVLRDMATNQEHLVPATGLRIGRLPDNDVVVADSNVSRYHAILWVQDNQVYIRDENTVNGTLVNGQCISAPTALQPSDQVQLGNTVFQVLAAPAGAPVPTGLPPGAMVPPVPPDPERPAWLLWAGVAGVAVVVLAVVALAQSGSQRTSPGAVPSEQPVVAVTATAEVSPPAVEESTTVPPGDSSATVSPTEQPPEPVATPTLPTTATPSPPCLPDAIFVEDVTIPDDTEMAAGETFTKTWRIRSSGCALWPDGTQWVFVSGDQMGGPDGMDVPVAPPDTTEDISVLLQAPETPDTYEGHWQLQTSGGNFFGTQAYVRIVVLEPAATPTPDTRPTVSVIVHNQTEETLELHLEGPATYDFALPPGDQTVNVVTGTYTYTAKSCGGKIESATEELKEGSEWEWWCG